MGRFPLIPGLGGGWGCGSPLTPPISVLRKVIGRVYGAAYPRTRETLHDQGCEQIVQRHQRRVRVE